MPAPLRALPVVQNWDCHHCGNCCRGYTVRVTDAEAEMLAKQGWPESPTVGTPGQYRLRHTAGGACQFLDADQRCRIHAKFGARAKPLACRLYPFIFVPAGDHWRVSLRLGCPSASANRGRAVTEQAGELEDLLRDLEVAEGRADAATVPALQPGQPSSWGDLARFQRTLSQVMAVDATPVEYRLRTLLSLSALCRVSRFNAVRGRRLDEFLNVISRAAAEDTPESPVALAPPGWLGRVLFRQTLALYARRDTGRDAGLGVSTRYRRLKSAWRFALGRGRVPQLHARMPDATFEMVEDQPTQAMPEVEALLTRYYQLKIDSGQFCGVSNYRKPLWPGLESLVLTYPVACWLARLFQLGGLDPEPAMRLALEQVDDHFAHNPFLGSDRHAWVIETLRKQGELPRLVAWYAR